MVTGFPVWAICMVSLMIASWFSIARKCEELPLQRDVCPSSTNPQLMASRGNRPQQPHILQRFHVHNSFARLKKRESRIVKIRQQSQLQEEKETPESVSSPNFESWLTEYHFYRPYTSTKPVKKNSVIISDNFPYGRAEAAGLFQWLWETSTALPGGLELNQQTVIRLTTLQFTELRRDISLVLFCWFVLRTNNSLHQKLPGCGWEKGKLRNVGYRWSKSLILNKNSA